MEMKKSVEVFSALCLEHWEQGKFIEPEIKDRKNGVITATFKCPKGHTFVKQFLVAR